MENLTWAKVGAVVAVALVVQVVLCNPIVILGAHPDLMVVLPVTAGIVAGPEIGSVIGFVAGMVADLVVPTPFGLSAVVFTLAGYGAGSFVASPYGNDFYNARITGSVLGVIASTLGYALAAAIIGQPGIVTWHLFATLAVVAAGSLVFSPVVFVAWRWALSSIGRLGFGPRVPSGGSALR